MKLFTLIRTVRQRRWPAYVIGLCAVSLSLGARYALGDAALKFPFVIFLPPVILTTFLGGIRPGIAAALLAALAVDLTLLAPLGRLLPEWPDGWYALAFYALTVGIDIALIHGMTSAIERAIAAEAALRQVNEDLELRVEQRTAALSQQIVEREAAEAKVRQMQKIESVGQLTGGIAHDFNNMLAVIIGSLELARRRLGHPDKLLGYLDDAEEGAKRAARLVSRLLAFSRQQELEPAVLDPDRLVEGMSDLWRRTIGEQVAIETVFAAEGGTCFADAIQVENAILNLAVNARDAMPGGGSLTIETARVDLDEAFVRDHPGAAPGAYVAISVKDNGSGMPPEVVEKAFEPFFTTKEIGKGTGLGLSQVYGFVKQSGGHVTITSSVGVGTTITLYLPRLDDAQALAPTRDISQVPMAVSDEIVLVVEDEPSVRSVSSDALRELGYGVVQATDVEQALSLLGSQPRIDLLFTDVVMPSMTGEQLAAAARVMRPDLKVLFTTGYARETLKVHMTTWPDVALLPKPFTVPQLAQKVRLLLDLQPVA